MFVGPGGLVNKAVSEVYVEPYRAETGTQITIADWTQTAGELRAQVESGKHAWDLVVADEMTLDLACKEGLIEPLDWSRIVDKSLLVDTAVQKCGAGLQSWGGIIAYHPDLVKNPPNTISEFFDVDRWPGKTIGLFNDPRQTIEFALLADGVPPNKVYEVLRTPGGVDRAFAKLDTIKSKIKWWTTGAEQVQRMVSGDVAVSYGWNGRVQGVNQGNVKLSVDWRAGGLTGGGYMAILKGSPKQKAVYEFMHFVMSRPDLQAKYPSYINYGPPLRAAYKLMPPEMARGLPTSEENIKYLLPVDAAFWTDHIDEINQRFASWIAK